MEKTSIQDYSRKSTGAKIKCLVYELEERGRVNLTVLGINGNTPVVSIGGLTLASVLKEADRGQDKCSIVVVDLDKQALNAVKKAKREKKNTILVRFEPAVVCPLNFRKKAIDLFDQVVDVGRNFVESSSLEHWPQNWPTDFEDPLWLRGGRAEKACLVNANKLSFIPGELYSLRRQVIDAGHVDTFGHGWEMGRSIRVRKMAFELAIAAKAQRGFSLAGARGWFRIRPATKGSVVDKLETMSTYKVAVVIENSADYLSEKLLDAIFAGCIPVYVGPDPGEWGIGEGLYVRAEANVQSISAAINIALQMDQKVFSLAVDSFIRDPANATVWDAHKVFDRLAQTITKGAD